MLDIAWRRPVGVSAILWTFTFGVLACGQSKGTEPPAGSEDEQTNGTGGTGEDAGVGGTSGSGAASGTSDGDGSGGSGGSGGGGGSGGAAETTTASGGTSGAGGSGGDKSAGSGGEGGSGGTLITAGPINSVPLAGGELEKLDILFVIDNSISMADKQQIFQTGVPTLVERLINPVCVSTDDPDQIEIAATPTADCSAGFEREFAPLTDVHVGITSTSLGGHGGQICTPEGPNGSADYDPSENDRALLLPTVRSGLDSYEGLGFLAWDPNGTKSPAGESDHAVMIQNFQDQVVAAGEDGCGYESTLEAWYRFLVDPTPPLAVVVENGVAVPATDDNGGVIVDQELLEQRAAFLRPDSVVAIVMLTDENDCSIVDGGIAYLTAQATLDGRQFNLPQSTTACDNDPNSACCRSCGLNESAPPAGCMALGDDPKCQAGRPSGTDALNLRCYRQKERFGFDLLYPVERYIDGLTQSTIYDTHSCSGDTCPLVDNPLFVSDDGLRSASRVVLTGIIGVPWQDIATEESLEGGRLRYMSPEQLVAAGRWDVMLGDPAQNVSPTDPLMVESVVERTGNHPLTGEALAPASSTDPQANSINGHEYENSSPDDLQYACIFPLETPRDCSTGTGACDCTDADVQKNRPLCNPPQGGAAGSTQYYGKAYPGVRHLEVIRGLGTRAMPASICPKLATGSTVDPEFGYNPAVDAIIRRVEAGLGSSCVPELPSTVTADLTCRVIEVGRDNCDCDATGRRPIADDVQASVDDELDALCAAAGVTDCSSYCACEILPLQGDDLEQCTTELEPSSGDGWCYVSPGQGVGVDELVEHCPSDSRRTVRVVGAAADTFDTELRLLCQ